MTIIDCDIHPTLPGLPALVPFMDDYWRDFVESRGLTDISLSTYRPTLPITARADWRSDNGFAAADLPTVQRQLLDAFAIDLAICNVVHGGSSVVNSYFGAAICKATNDWLAAHWLADRRLRGSIVVPVQEPDLAAQEIERLAGDSRFVQVLLPASGDVPFGRRQYWPIYRAASRHGLPVALHPGGGGRHPQSYIGWHTHYVEDYANQAVVLQNQLLSMIYEGVFTEFPDLKLVLLESGVTWLPAFLTDANNKWMALRREVPWVTEAPFEIARRHVRCTTQPFDAPADDRIVDRLLDMLGSEDMLLFSTDYPHWQFDGNERPMPTGLGTERRERLTTLNPLATYPRLERHAS